jgi:threonine dehydratase
MRWIVRDTHNLPEPAGAATVAAAWKLRERLAGKTVVGILSGGNCDVRLLGELMENGQ